MDQVHQNKDQIKNHGSPFMDQVHGPPIFTTPKNTVINKNEIRQDDLRS